MSNVKAIDLEYQERQETDMTWVVAPVAYEIDYDNWRIRNHESHGWKDIVSWEGGSDEPSPHLVYINDDGRMWFQAITWEIISRLELAEAIDAYDDFEEEPFDEFDYM